MVFRRQQITQQRIAFLLRRGQNSLAHVSGVPCFTHVIQSLSPCPEGEVTEPLGSREWRNFVYPPIECIKQVHR